MRQKYIARTLFFGGGGGLGEVRRGGEKSGGHSVQFDTHRARANKDERDFNEPA